MSAHDQREQPDGSEPDPVGPSAACDLLVARVVILDRQDSGQIAGMGWQERMEACYRWVDAVNLPVHDEMIIWGDDGHEQQRVGLEQALDECCGFGAGLLVYDLECLSSDPALIGHAVEHLARHGLVVMSVRDGVVSRDGH